MNKNFLEKMKKDLLLQKQELILKSNQPINIDIDGDETDKIQGNILANLVSQLNSRDLNKLKLINNSLKRIEDGIYGFCQDCEDVIPDKRLLINPYFLTCLSCAEEREKEEKQNKER